MKSKVNDVIFPSGCEASAINLDNKNMKIGIFTGGTSVRSKNIFTDISLYPTRKHEMKFYYFHFAGNQPEGTMLVKTNKNESCAGFERFARIEITYKFPDGKQGV